MCLLLLINVIAFLHAYKFTHFDPEGGVRTPESTSFSIWQKIGLAVSGVRNPRPMGHRAPEGEYESFRLQSNKGIECWRIRTEQAKGTVALFHGYGGEKSSMLDKAVVFRELGYDVLLVDFMGSGGSEGNQTTIGYKEAEQVKTVYEYLVSEGEQKIILFGTSMGAVAIMKALHDHALPVSSVILECPFGTMLETVKARFALLNIPDFPMAHLLVFWGGVQNGFNAFAHNPVRYAEKIHCPVLLLYGRKDQKVSQRETEAIYENIPGQKVLKMYPLAGHENYLIKYSEEWREDVQSFLD